MTNTLLTQARKCIKNKCDRKFFKKTSRYRTKLVIRNM